MPKRFYDLVFHENASKVSFLERSENSHDALYQPKTRILYLIFILSCSQVQRIILQQFRTGLRG